jgi:putative peptide zinc metalloprotease protein
MADPSPRLRAEVVFGPPQRRRGEVVFYGRNRATDQAFVVRARERFLLAGMDGRPLEELARDYQRTFRTPLAARSLQRLVDLARQRHLLEGGATTPVARAPTGRRLRLTRPLVALERLRPWLLRLARPGPLLVAALAVVAIELLVCADRRSLWATARVGGWAPWVALASFCLLSASVHELGHAAAGIAFGARVREVGLMWRRGLPRAYCRVEDILLLPRRWHRVGVALAGPLVSLLLMAPFALLWLVGPAPLRPLAARVLVFYNLGVLSLLLPLPPLDGYWMLGYALDRPELKEDLLRVWRRPPRSEGP